MKNRLKDLKKSFRKINTTDTQNKHKAVRPRIRMRRELVFHRYHRFKNLSRQQKRKQVRVGLVVLAVVALIAFLVIWKDYHERPGILERSSLKATDRDINTITLEWKGTRNTDSYTVYYRIKGESAARYCV